MFCKCLLSGFTGTIDVAIRFSILFFLTLIAKRLRSWITYSKMFLSLAVVASLVTFGLSATYDKIEDLPNVDWDFIVVGGICAGTSE